MLDVSVRSQILHVLLELQRARELALLFITHDLSLAWQLCDRIAVMYLGRIVEQGDARDVIERPGHPYTQALVEAVPPRKQRTALGGELPDAANLPSGCRFHPRCPKRFDACDQVDPELYPAGEPTHEAVPASSASDLLIALLDLLSISTLTHRLGGVCLVPSQPSLECSRMNRSRLLLAVLADVRD